MTARSGVEITIDQPQALLPQRRPDPFDPLPGMPGELDAWIGTGLKPSVARQLQPLQRCTDDRPSDVQGGREFVGRRRSGEQQHRHDRQVAPVQREDPSRHFVERVPTPPGSATRPARWSERAGGGRRPVAALARSSPRRHDCLSGPTQQVPPAFHRKIQQKGANAEKTRTADACDRGGMMISAISANTSAKEI